MSNNESIKVVTSFLKVQHLAVPLLSILKTFKAVNIKPMLARLQNAIINPEILEQMVLLESTASACKTRDKSSKMVNLVVGYNGSVNSQTALDITLLIAHQTRLATQKQVTVHVVYVVDEDYNNKLLSVYNSLSATIPSAVSHQLQFPEASTRKCATPVLTPPKTDSLAVHSGMISIDVLEQADKILWQARCLAEKWKGTFVAHLRFGCVTTELRKIVESEAAALLFLGCNSAAHPIVQQLSFDFPCSVLGVPTLLSLQEMNL